MQLHNWKNKVQMRLKSKNNWCTAFLSYPEYRIKADLQDGKLILKMIAMTVGLIAGKEDKSFKMPQHLQSMIIASKDNFNKLKMESNGRIKLVVSFRSET
jgi:hypothetical protein